MKKDPPILQDNNQHQQDIGEDMFTLPESTLEIQQFAKEFVAEWQISETSMERDHTHEFPTEIVKALEQDLSFSASSYNIFSVFARTHTS